MIVAYLLLHFGLFSRHEDYERFKRWGVVFGVVTCLEIAFALINFILIGTSICNDEPMATAGILSSLAILIINSATVITSAVYFLSKTKVATSQVAAEMRPLNNTDVSKQNDSSARPIAKKEEKVEEPPQPEPDQGDDDDYGIE